MTEHIVSNKETQSKNAVILWSNEMIIVRAESDYILHREFIDLFNQVEEIYKETPVDKVIFDKSHLSVFNQNSMEWYYTEWKVRMLDYGLTKHYKILPRDEAFVKMVTLCKEKIYNQLPEALLQKMDIRYFNSIEEAVQQ